MAYDNLGTYNIEAVDVEGVTSSMEEMEIDPNDPPQPGAQLPGGGIYIPPGTSLDDELLMLAGAYLTSNNPMTSPATNFDDEAVTISSRPDYDPLSQLQSISNEEQANPVDFMNRSYPYLSELSRAQAYYIPRDPTHLPRSIEQLFAAHPQYFTARGEELERASLPDTEARIEELSLAIADLIVARSNEGDSRPPPSSPLGHMYYPYWVHGHHPSSELIQRSRGHEVSANERALALYTPIPSSTSSDTRALNGNSFGSGMSKSTPGTLATTNASGMQTLPPTEALNPLDLTSPETAALSLLREMYAHFPYAAGRELENESLPTSDFDTFMLSSWMADQIAYRGGKSVEGEYIPPFSPKCHPCYPTWMSDHPSNRIIFQCFESVVDKVTDFGFLGSLEQ